MRKKHAEELATCVREANKRYSDMLAQRLNDEDARRAALEEAHKVCTRVFKRSASWLVRRNGYVTEGGREGEREGDRKRGSEGETGRQGDRETGRQGDRE